MKEVSNFHTYISKDTSFDFLEYGSSDFFELSFRVVRLQLSKDSDGTRNANANNSENSYNFF